MKTDNTGSDNRTLASVNLPVYAKASLILVSIYMAGNLLYLAQDLIIPLIYAIILSILLNPAINYLIARKFNRMAAILTMMLLLTGILCTLVILLFYQAENLHNSMPALTLKFNELMEKSITAISKYLYIDETRIDKWLIKFRMDLSSNSSATIGQTITEIGGLLSTIFLTPVYIFMLLLYKNHLLEFIYALFKNVDKVSEVLFNTKTIIQGYLLGLCMEIGILSVLNSAGLLLLGIDYAILLGILGALLNIIPYLGGLLGVATYMIIALATKTPEYALYVLVLYVIIQFVDNNIIVPKIVGSKVKLNAFFSLLTVIIGAALWGIPGMFLSIPITAVLKLILDKIESLNHWGKLLGDTITPTGDLKFLLRKLNINKFK